MPSSAGKKKSGGHHASRLPNRPRHLRCFQLNRSQRPLHSFPTRRSSDLAARQAREHLGARRVQRAADRLPADPRPPRSRQSHAPNLRWRGPRAAGRGHRSEEHTSELQSHHDLVCRLLLEKKNPGDTTRHGCPIALVISVAFNSTAHNDLYTLSLHDALPISLRGKLASTLARGASNELLIGYQRIRDHRDLASRTPLIFVGGDRGQPVAATDRKSTRLNSSHITTSYAVFCWKKKIRGTPRVTAAQSPSSSPLLSTQPLTTTSTLFPYTTLFRSRCAASSRAPWREARPTSC